MLTLDVGTPYIAGLPFVHGVHWKGADKGMRKSAKKPNEMFAARTARAYKAARGRTSSRGMYAWLGGRIGVTGQTVSRWCNGRLTISERAWRALEDAERRVARELIAEAERKAASVTADLADAAA